MTVFRILLFPFSLVYGAIAGIRNHLFNIGRKPSASFDLPVISVGNLSVGGTGKTPMVEYLVRLLSSTRTVATLSRGYGRSTKGFRIATPADDASTLGDEPFQYFKKFGSKVAVSVGEERALAISYLVDQRPAVDVILLDDAFQHRQVTPSFSILLTDFERPFYKDFVLPTGLLREWRSGASRANVVVVTKCPEVLSESQMSAIRKSISSYVQCPVFFSTIDYETPVAVNPGHAVLKKEVILVSGIANAKPFENFVAAHYTLIDHLEFRDHHRYSHHDISKLLALAQQYPNAMVLTTEKDMVKLTASVFQQQVGTLPLFYLPIATKFLANGAEFDALIRSVVTADSKKTD